MKVIVYGATWCPSCGAMDIIVDELKKKHPTWDIEHRDVEEYEVDAEEYHIMNLPTVLAVDENMNPIERYVGLMGKSETEKWISRFQDPAAAE